MNSTNIWNHHLGLLTISTPKKRHHQLTVVEHPACNFSLTPSSAWSEVKPFVFGCWKHLGEHHWRYKFHNPSNYLDKLIHHFKGNNRAQWFLTLNTWVTSNTNLLGHTLFAPEISYATGLSHFSPAFHTFTPKLVAEKPVIYTQQRSLQAIFDTKNWFAATTFYIKNSWHESSFVL